MYHHLNISFCFISIFASWIALQLTWVLCIFISQRCYLALSNAMVREFFVNVITTKTVTMKRRWSTVIDGILVKQDDGMTWKRSSHHWPFERGIHRLIPLTKGVQCGTFKSFIARLNKLFNTYWVELPANWDAMTPTWRHCNESDLYPWLHSKGLKIASTIWMTSSVQEMVSFNVKSLVVGETRTKTFLHVVVRIVSGSHFFRTNQFDLSMVTYMLLLGIFFTEIIHLMYTMRFTLIKMVMSTFMDYHIVAETKWPPFPCAIVKRIFLNENVSLPIKISLNISSGSNWQWLSICSDNGLAPNSR